MWFVFTVLPSWLLGLRALGLCFLRAGEPFTALSRHLDPPWFGTTQLGQQDLMRAQGDAPHSSVHACALVFAVWTESFSVLVNLTVILAGSTV